MSPKPGPELYVSKLCGLVCWWAPRSSVRLKGIASSGGPPGKPQTLEVDVEHFATIIDDCTKTTPELEFIAGDNKTLHDFSAALDGLVLLVRPLIFPPSDQND